MNKKLVYSLLLSGAIRYFISISSYAKTIQNHVEVSTPLNSFKRCKLIAIGLAWLLNWHLKFSLLPVKEGAFLYEMGIDPYKGDIYHENPFILMGSTFLLKHFSDSMSVILILLDLLTAVLIFVGAKGITKKNVRKSLCACISLIYSLFSVRQARID